MRKGWEKLKRTSSGDKTKLVIAQSLREILKTKPFDKIKIREIVDNCNLNRQTFYYHFQDIYELVEWMYTHDGSLIVRDTFKAGGLSETVRLMLVYIENHKSELLNISNSKASYYFFDFLRKRINECYILCFDLLSSEYNIPESYKSFIAEYLTCAIVGVLEHWIKNTSADRFSSEEFLEMLETIEDLHKVIIEKYSNDIEN